MQPIALAPGQVTAATKRRRAGGGGGGGGEKEGCSRRKAAERPRTMFSSRSRRLCRVPAADPSRIVARAASPGPRRLDPRPGQPVVAVLPPVPHDADLDAAREGGLRRGAARDGRVEHGARAPAEGAARAVRRTRLRKILVRWLAAAMRRRERDGSQFRVKLRPGAVVSGATPLASMVGIGRDPIAVLGLHRPTRSGCGYRIQLSIKFERLRLRGGPGDRTGGRPRWRRARRDRRTSARSADAQRDGQEGRQTGPHRRLLLRQGESVDAATRPSRSSSSRACLHKVLASAPQSSDATRRHCTHSRRRVRFRAAILTWR